MSDELDELNAALSVGDFERVDRVLEQASANGQRRRIEALLDELNVCAVEVFAQIDRVCVGFEQAWIRGSTPRIEEFLGTAEGVQRYCLLSHLLQIDIDHRRQTGVDSPPPAEYACRFPATTGLVHAVFLVMAMDQEEHPERDQTRSVRAADEHAAGCGEAIYQRQGVLQLTCPHCGSDITLNDAQVQEVTCENCGSTFDLDPKATNAYPILPKMIDRFEIIERLGKGAFGVVYRARDPKFNLTVAIKLAKPETVDTQGRLQRFLNDAQAARRLKHPHIAQVYETGETRGVPYIVSDFVEGMTLDERLSGGPFTFQETAELVRQMADALDYAHGKGVVHRDVKPSNIVIDHSGQSWLIDFGLAHCDEGDIHVTLPGQVFGTPAYMSPEQARGDTAAIDARTDVYSLGVVLYEMLTGELPFRGRRRMLLEQVQRDNPPPPRRLNDHIPRDLETICLKCLEKEPRNRYASAAALREDLDRHSQGQPILARPIGPITRGWRWCLRNPLVSGLTGSVVLLLVLLVVALALLLDVYAERAARREAKANLYRERTEALVRILTDDLETITNRYEELDGKIKFGPFDPVSALGDRAVVEHSPDLAPLADISVPLVSEILVLSSHPEFGDSDLGDLALQAFGRLNDAAERAIPKLRKIRDDKDLSDPGLATKHLQDIRRALECATDGLQQAAKPHSPIASDAEQVLERIKHTLDVKLQESAVEDDEK